MKLPDITLKSVVTRLEDSIIVLSGPALAISGIIAGVDLLTGGHILQQVGWLTLAWAITLLLTLDFQVLSLGVRAKRIYTSDTSIWRKVGELVLAVAIAASISYVSIQMQSIIARSNSAGVPIDQAATQLGINTLALIWERSILVLVLIFLSGWFRESGDETPETLAVSPAPPTETPTTISDETVQLILSKLAKLDELEQSMSRQAVSVSESRQTPLALPEPTNETEPNEPALEAQIAALLAIKADLPSREIATIVGRPHTTVYRTLNRVKQAKQLETAKE